VAHTVVVQRVAKTPVLYTDSLIVLVSGILIGMSNVSSSSLERGRDKTVCSLHWAGVERCVYCISFCVAFLRSSQFNALFFVFK
jgi:hypothetical protein